MTQQDALNILKTGKNVFLTGAAGSGKTHLLREYIKYLRGIDAEVAITASTGIAATHMGGMTIHSWSGVGIRDYLSESDLAEIADKSYLRSRIVNTSVLIIDEISMLHHYRIDLVNSILKAVRGSDLPFGGIQVIFCGDFFQLPPVRRAGDEQVYFAYHSPSWKELDLRVCYLEEQYRQNDQAFLKILNAIRSNSVNEDIVELLEEVRSRKIEGYVEPTKLYSHNVNVDSENKKELGNIGGNVYVYKMATRGSKNLVENLKKSCLAPETLELKVGAKVMFVKNNFDEGYVNGTLGVVDRLSYGEIVIKTFSGKKINVKQESWMIEEDGKVKAEISQYPLRLAWAITVHKSQGMSLDAAEVDLSQCFERGMGYVALSRVRSLSGLSVKGLNNIALQVSDEVLRFDNKFRQMSELNLIELEDSALDLENLHNNFKEKVSRIKKGKIKAPKINTVEETKRLFNMGKTIKEIAKERNMKEGTVLDHVEKLKAEDPRFNIYNLRESLPKAKFQKIYMAFQRVGMTTEGSRPLSPVKKILGDKYSYEDLRIVRMFL